MMEEVIKEGTVEEGTWVSPSAGVTSAKECRFVVVFVADACRKQVLLQSVVVPRDAATTKYSFQFVCLI